MLLKIWSPLRLLSTQERLVGVVEGEDMNWSSSNSSDSVQLRRPTMAVGLGILAETSATPTTLNAYNIVVNSGLFKSSKPVSSYSTKQKFPKSTDCCFLKSCCLCNKKLSLDKDVYMYMGDQGFCSVECRNRQIYLEDMKEREISAKKRLALISHCRDSNRRDTNTNISNYRQHRSQQRPSYQKNKAIFI